MIERIHFAEVKQEDTDARAILQNGHRDRSLDVKILPFFEPGLQPIIILVIVRNARTARAECRAGEPRPSIVSSRVEITQSRNAVSSSPPVPATRTSLSPFARRGTGKDKTSFMNKAASQTRWIEIVLRGGTENRFVRRIQCGEHLRDTC